MADSDQILVKKQAANTPAIASDTTAMASNTARSAWQIQNLGTNPLFVRLGASASTTVFHVVLKASAVNDDGTGGIVGQSDGVIFTGEISIAGTDPRYTVLEIS